MEYSRNFGSNFPSELISVGTKKDINNSVKTLVSQYYTYIDHGNIDAANTLYNNNKDILKDYSMNMEDFNRYEEELFNIGLSIFKQITNIVSPDEPVDQVENGYWYQDY